MISFRLSAALLAALLLAAPVHAQPAGSESDPREVSARQLFAVGKYAEALEIYGKLYADTTHPTYLRNIGRCYQNLGEPDRAISSFREYLRQAREVTPDQQKVVEGYIAEMEALKRKQGERTATAPTVVPSATVDATAAPPATAGEEASRTPAYIVGGISLAALGAGAVFGVLAISNDHAADPDCPMDRCNLTGKAKNDAALRDAWISNALVGAGIVGAAVATYLYLTSGPAAAPERSGAVRVRPTVGGGLTGLGLETSW